MTAKIRILIASALTICSCKNLSTISHSTTDILRTSTLHYDSIIIDRQTLTTYSHDTVYVDRWQTEYRYRLHTDTLHHYHTDTVCTTIYKEAPNKNYDMLPWVMVGVVVLIVGVVIKAKILRNP